MGSSTAGTTAFERLHACFDNRGSHPAIRFDQQVWTYTDLARHARGYAHGLDRLGVRAGDRIAVFADSRPEVVAALVGHYHLHAVHVPINTRYRASEVAHILADSGARFVVVDRTHLEVLQELEPGLRDLPRILVGHDALPLRRAQDHAFDDLIGPPMAPGRPRDEDPALIIYTSGTTGKSKGVVLSHRAVVENMEALTGLWQWSADDVLALSLPLFHVHGLCIGLHGGLLHGLTIDLAPRFEADRIVAKFRAGATIFMGVPTMYAMLLEHLNANTDAADALRRGRLFTSGSAALSAEHFAQFESYTGHRILERYGMSETLITLSNPFEGERRPGSVGKPVPGCRVRLVDEDGQPVTGSEPGEIWVQSNGIMDGYWNLPEATDAAFVAGWFRTGDIATRDDDGYVRIVGRRSVDIIKSGGFKISAREIEERIATHAAVREVAVVGMPDPKWGQKITAAVVVHPGALDDDGRGLLVELAGYVGAQLAEYKKPRALVVLEQLPRNALGKVQKHRIVDGCRSGAMTLIG